MTYLTFSCCLQTQTSIVERPYRIPISDWAAVLLMIPPILGLIVLFAIANWTTYIFVAFVFVLGIMFYYLQQLAKRRKWCDFIEVPSRINRVNVRQYDEVIRVEHEDEELQLEIDWDDNTCISSVQREIT